MNRHERRKQAAKDRNNLVTMEATSLFAEFLAWNGDAIDLLRKVFGSVCKNTHACAACDEAWRDGLGVGFCQDGENPENNPPPRQKHGGEWSLAPPQPVTPSEKFFRFFSNKQPQTAAG